MPVPRTDVTIRLLDEDDWPAVASLYTNVFGELALSAFMCRRDWQFRCNPACDSVDSLMWVAESRAGIVGFLASFPTRFKVFEKEAIIRLPCDLMVSREARGRGVGEKLIREYMASEELIINALGYSPVSGRMFHRLGYRDVDAERITMRPRDLRPIFRDILTRRRGGRFFEAVAPTVAVVAGGVLNIGLTALNYMTKPAATDEVEIRRCEAAGAAFDRLWKRMAPAFPIAAVRGRRWVQWRFLDDPCFEHDLLCAYDHAGELLGYVDVRVSKRRHLRFGRIMDLFCDPATPALTEALLAAGVQCLEAERADIITSLGHLPGIERVISKYCYLTPKRLQRPALFIWKGDPALADAVYEAANWHLTHADGDDGFSP